MDTHRGANKKHGYTRRDACICALGREYASRSEHGDEVVGVDVNAGEFENVDLQIILMVMPMPVQM